MDAARSPVRRRPLAEAGAIVWLVLVGGAFLAPALSHGSALGPYDILHLFGITATAHPSVHNVVGSDEIQEFIPWQTLSWLEVHAGHLPLWDPSNLLGMPLAFNFESAPFSLTIALGYLFPLHLAHTATVAARLVLAGSGVYVLGRMLRLGILPAVMGATIFELSGAFTIWLGTYEAGVFCLAGWVLAASVGISRGRRRGVPVALLAVGLALAFAAGEPQVDSLLVAFVGVFAIVVALGRWRAGERRRAGRALLDHTLGLVGACGLVAPIYLPSLQLLLRSARSSGPYISGLPPADLTHLLFSSYDGVPTALGSVIGPDNLYVSMCAVGAVGLVLALVGLSLLRTRPDLRAEVVALLVIVAALVGALFAPSVAAVLRHVPLVRVFRLDLATTLLDLALALLAAFGAEALLGRGAGSPDHSDPWADRLLLAGTVVVVLVLAVLGARLALGSGHLSALQARVRMGAFVWPAIAAGACALVLGARALAQRRGPARGAHAPVKAPPSQRMLGWSALAGRGGVVLLIGIETVALVVGGATTLSSSARPLHETPAIAQLQRVVGHGLVGMGSCTENAFPNLGIMPDVNADYSVRELVDYDPILPTTYYASYGALTGRSGKPLVPHVLCPAITSVRLARAYGVSYVLEPPGAAGPPGTEKVAVVHGEGVFRVPGSGTATLTPLSALAPASAIPPAAPARTVVAPSSQPAPGTWRVTVRAARRSLLVLRVTDVPGWHASIDGRPLALKRYGNVMLSADVPSGRYVVTLRYWPGTLSIGLVIAAVSAAVILASLGWAGRERRLRRRRFRGNVR